MPNNFCFHVYAQKSLFIAENGNAFFWTSSSSSACEFGVSRAGSQLKTKTISYPNNRKFDSKPQNKNSHLMGLKTFFKKLTGRLSAWYVCLYGGSDIKPPSFQYQTPFWLGEFLFCCRPGDVFVTRVSMSRSSLPGCTSWWLCLLPAPTCGEPVVQSWCACHRVTMFCVAVLWCTPGLTWWCMTEEGCRDRQCGWRMSSLGVAPITLVTPELCLGMAIHRSGRCRHTILLLHQRDITTLPTTVLGLSE